MSHMVICKVCGKRFDRDLIQAVHDGTRRYSHYTCKPDGVLVEMPQKSQEAKDRDDLYNYIEKLFQGKVNYGMVGKSIKQFTTNPYNYTYSGIKKALIYFYEVKKNPIAKANGSISIVPYIYNDAFNYYYSLWEAKQKNDNKIIQKYIPKEEIVTIQPPQREIKKSNLFSFLDEEDIE